MLSKYLGQYLNKKSVMKGSNTTNRPDLSFLFYSSLNVRSKKVAQ